MTPGGGENIIKKLLVFERNNKSAWAQRFTWQQTVLGFRQSRKHPGIDSENQCLFMWVFFVQKTFGRKE